MTTEVRFLDHNDLDNYINLFNKSEYLMKVKKTEEETNKFISSITADFNNPNSVSKYVGAFTDGSMTATVCGKFWKNTPFWFLKNSFNITAPGLNAGVQYAKVFRSMCQLLQAHAEDNGYYGFYTRRPYTHAVPFEKLVNRFGDRYIVFHEEFYPAGAPVSKLLHRPFFNDSEIAEIDFLITLAMLRPELRIDILDKKHSKSSMYKKEDFETK